MYYKRTRESELTRGEMEEARQVFRGKLLRLRYPPSFIVRNCDELLAIAYTEYAKAIDKGIEIEDPPAWIVHVAWARLKNLLHAEGYRPRMVSGETVFEALPSGTPDPQELTEAGDRARKVRRAVAKLSEEQRKVVALTFFEGYSVRETAKHLGWSAGKVQHHQRTALQHLRRYLPVRSSDELAVDVGMAAWLSLAGGASAIHLPAGFEAMLDRAGHGTSTLWAKVNDLARRFSLGGGGDAATAAASSGAGRAVGVCASGVAIACIAGASGLVGPGVGVFSGSNHKTQAPRPGHVAVAPRQHGPPASSAPTGESNASSSSTTPTESHASPQTATSSKRQQQKATESAEQRQVEEQASGITRAASETSGSREGAAASEVESSSPPVTVSPAPSGTAGSAEETRQAEKQFSPFK